MNPRRSACDYRKSTIKQSSRISSISIYKSLVGSFSAAIKNKARGSRLFGIYQK